MLCRISLTHDCSLTFSVIREFWNPCWFVLIGAGWCTKCGFSCRYDVGGVVSILALEGVFTLMQEHNLDYPLFYGKLYALFDPSIFHVKYRARFFRLADKFLKSTYLPG